MPKTTRILHKGHEFLLLDERPRGRPRTITFMVRPNDPVFRTAVDERIVPTPLGTWAPIGHWDSKSCRPFQTAGEPWVSTMKEITETYLRESRALRRKNGSQRYWQPRVHGEPLYSVHPNHPHGLALPLFSSGNSARAAARKASSLEPHPLDAAGELGANSGETAPEVEGEGTRPKVTDTIDNLFTFLVDMAREGIAGALLDESEPIYFCSDEKQSFQFLRLKLGDDGSIEEWLLSEEGNWVAYEGFPQLELHIDEDLSDEAMTRHLGKIPFYGFQPGLPYFCIWDKQTDSALIFDDSEGDEDPLEALEEPKPPRPTDESSMLPDESLMEEEVKLLPLFHRVEDGEDFMRAHGLRDEDAEDLDSEKTSSDDAISPRYELISIDDLTQLITSTQEVGAVPRLHPESHRAYGGTFWIQDGSIVLDSFSGFWSSNDAGHTFQKV